MTQDVIMGKSPITVRVRDDLLERLRKATDKEKNFYAPTQTQVFERGLELALNELEKKK